MPETNIENENSRYSDNLTVKIDVQYYEVDSDNSTDDKTVYKDGNFINFAVYPSFYGEYYTDYKEADLSLSGDYIKKITVTVKYKGTVKVTVGTLLLSWLLSEVEAFNQSSQESKTLYGTFIEVREDDPEDAEVGRIWLRIDIEPA
jgi:hypothetical protein